MCRAIWLICFTGSMACVQPQKGQEQALKAAGNNRPQLEEVLSHYSREEDSLKRRAAEFLICHMPGNYGFYGPEVNRSSIIFSLIDTASYYRDNLSNDDKFAIGDSLMSIYGLAKTDTAGKIIDSKIMPASYLINNIDFAFKAWQEAPWHEKVSFDDFCEYILPYRIRNERLEYWRPAFYTEYMQLASNAGKPDDAKEVFYHMNWYLNTSTTFSAAFAKYYPYAQSVGDVLKGKIGSCEATSFFATTAMRSIGLPVAFDQIMHWGNSNNQHFMNHLVGPFMERKLITNENALVNTWSLVDFSSDYHESQYVYKKGEIPPELYVQYVRTIPKVYRHSFSQSPELRRINNNFPENIISAEFRNTRLKDVTDEYVTTTDVTLPLGADNENCRLAYLCVFNINGWHPVAVTEVKNNKAEFKKIGRMSIYLPATLLNGRYIPLGAPFYIDSMSVTHPVKAEPKITQDLKIVRKYPLYAYTALHPQVLKGGWFEGANDSSFKDKHILYHISHFPFYMNEVNIARAGTFRYLRYVAPPGATVEPDNIAEVQFLDRKGKPITGNYIGTGGTIGHEISKAFDGDMNSYYENALVRNGWIGLDLGAGKAAEVGRIRFCPRNDTNCIIPGNDYELFYWDGQGWESMGIQTASGYSLAYPQAPAGALFWLHCHSGGQEERIFTWTDGRQVFW